LVIMDLLGPQSSIANYKSPICSFRTMIHRFTSVGGFVLAGGASRRMGRDKAKLALEGKTLLERQVRLLQAVCGRVGVVGPREFYSGLEIPVFPDEYPRRGPLGGIHSGLLHSRSEYNLFLACDMPYLEVRFLGWLVEQALQHQADVTVPRTRDGRHTLCAVFRRRVLAAIRYRLATGQNKVRGLFPRASSRVIPWTEVARAGFSPRIFDNINTPQDYEAARAGMKGEAVQC
jgi:molybdopterin-guanine dinucleotide biosynthesis protein A